MVDLSLPEKYVASPLEELSAGVAARKKELGQTLCILAHHYQRDEIVQYADFVGDSLKLSQFAAGQQAAKYIVFCGVHFMAESAVILAAPTQTVILPNMHAGCEMADMADDAAVETAIEEMLSLAPGANIVPITYVNSTAATKAVTARHGGACCTSSNVANVFRWAFASRADGGAGAEKIIAIPDQHLGLNTALTLGYSGDDCAVYNPRLPSGGLTAPQVQRAKFILWKGQCYVHQVFRVEDVRNVRVKFPGITIIVHPECPNEVVRLADASGSTEQIIAAVSAGKSGSQWAVGTESNLVHRLAKKFPDRIVRVLADRQAHCTQMARVTLGHLLWVLDGLAQGQVINRVAVEPTIAADARIALERMISIKAVKGITQNNR